MASVSIITVVKNNAIGLLKTLESAQSQDFSDWELLIIYAESEDSTLSVATKFSNKDARISLIAENEQGIYQAMNLGIKDSKADFFWFMNSGDQFYSTKSLSYGYNSIRNSSLGFMVGGYQIERDARLFKQKKGELTQIDFALSRRGACHQAMIFRKRAVIETGCFDTRFDLAADYMLCLKLIDKFGAAKLPAILATLEPDGISDRNLNRMHYEKSLIRREIFAKNRTARLLGWWWMMAASTKARLRLFGNGKKHPLG
jgi:glycosyltransferase involved in cell wall biosynthesis